MQKDELQRTIHKVIETSSIGASIRRVSLFGSQLHNPKTQKSDVDLLVEFSTPISIFALVQLEKKMGEALQKKVDLNTPNSLSKYFRDEVVRDAKPVYESAL